MKEMVGMTEENKQDAQEQIREALRKVGADSDTEAAVLRAFRGEGAEKANTQAISERLMALRDAARERALDADETRRLLGDASLLLARVEHLQEYCGCRP